MIQFSVYDGENYESGNDARDAGALYALCVAESFDSAQSLQELEDLMGGVQAAANCLGRDVPKLCYQNGDLYSEEMDSAECHEVDGVTSLRDLFNV